MIKSSHPLFEGGTTEVARDRLCVLLARSQATSARCHPQTRDVTYSATFFSFQVYLEIRLVIRFSVFLKSLIQFVIALAAIFVLVSRVNDFRHHTSDVVAGGLLGMIVGVWVVSKYMPFPVISEPKNIPS